MPCRLKKEKKTAFDFRVLGGSGPLVVVFIEECFHVGEVESIIAPLANAVGFKRPELAPESYRVRVDVQQMSDLIYGEHLLWRPVILGIIF
jgi:hypothetical protein